jgi:hypothetical protein
MGWDEMRGDDAGRVDATRATRELPGLPAELARHSVTVTPHKMTALHCKQQRHSRNSILASQQDLKILHSRPGRRRPDNLLPSKQPETELCADLFDRVR